MNGRFTLQYFAAIERSCSFNYVARDFSSDIISESNALSQLYLFTFPPHLSHHATSKSCFRCVLICISLSFATRLIAFHDLFLFESMLNKMKDGKAKGIRRSLCNRDYSDQFIVKRSARLVIGNRET